LKILSKYYVDGSLPNGHDEQSFGSVLLVVNEIQRLKILFLQMNVLRKIALASINLVPNSTTRKTARLIKANGFHSTTTWKKLHNSKPRPLATQRLRMA